MGWLLFFVGMFLLLWPWIAPYSPEAFVGEAFLGPQWKHWLGTDAHGRDVLTRVLYGAQLSLAVGFVGAAVSLCIGVTWGALAGYLGGRWDHWMMRVVDILYSLPSIILVIVLIATLERYFQSAVVAWMGGEWEGFTRFILLFIGLGAVSWLNMARIVRGQVLTLKTRAFLEASRLLGGGGAWILRKHILPNLWGIVLTYLTLTLPAVILYESFLSYLGLGIQPPHASLGSLIAEGAAQINPVRIYWWLIVFPCGALLGILLIFNLLGDGLRDLTDPQAGAGERP